MRTLVTGGTGVIGAGLIPELQSRKHSVRLLSRHASQDVKQWNDVEAFDGDVADPSSLSGAADGCDAVIHIAGIAAETPPDLTFEIVNVGGTRNVVAEAERASVARFLFISSLGADGGSSDYHRSKLTAEELVAQSKLAWTIIRPGAVYGPGDEIISLLLKMVRALPVVPVIDDGEQQFQPIWYQDLGRSIAACIDADVARQTLEIAGPDVTTMRDLIRRLREVTGRTPLRVPVPMLLAELATKVAGAVAHLPIDENTLTMLREENVIKPGKKNTLAELIGAEPTSLDRGLRMLADALPEQLPEDGVGSMEHKRFWADISGGNHPPASLMRIFRERITEIMPIEFAAEPGAATKVELGATMTGAIPMRGNIQVRVEVVEPERVVLATLEGHPLAGIVEFSARKEGASIRFAVDVYARAANVFDLVAMKTVGAPAQSSNWRTVVERMIEISGGTSAGVETEVRTLDDAEAARAERGIRSMVQARQRAESAPAEHPA